MLLFSAERRVLAGTGALLLAAGHIRGAEIGLLYALEEDWKAFALKAGGTPRISAAGQRRIAIMQVGPHLVRAVKMGSGCVETAVSATALLTNGRCDWIISIGPCGGLMADLKPGTVVMSDKVTSWQASKGTPAFPLPLPAPLAPLILDIAGKPNTVSYVSPTHSEPVEWLRLSAASGERFIQESEDRAAAAAVGQFVEMNLSGAVSAMNNFGVAGVHLRIVSDHADDNARENFAAFLRSYDGRLGLLAYDLILQSKPDPTAPSSYPTLRSLVQPRVAPSNSADTGKSDVPKP
jgi:nucleoside phosphorylase